MKRIVNNKIVTGLLSQTERDEYEAACTAVESALNEIGNPDTRLTASITTRRDWLNGTANELQLHEAHKAAFAAGEELVERLFSWPPRADVKALVPEGTDRATFGRRVMEVAEAANLLCKCRYEGVSESSREVLESVEDQL